MNRRHFLTTLLAIPAAGLLGCSHHEPLLRVSGIVWVGYEPLFLARTLGYYDPTAIRLVETPSNTEALMALASGEVEAATLTLDEYLLARDGGLDVQAIMVFDTSNGADVIMARPEIRTLPDLAGKRIGVEETAAGALMLSKTLEAAKLEPQQVRKVPVTGDQQVAMYRAGDVDALVSYEPFSSQLERQGAHRLYDSSHFPGLIVDVLVARRQALQQQPHVFSQLIAGYMRAINYLKANPGEAFAKMAPRMQIPPHEVKNAFAGIHVMSLEENYRWLSGPSPLLVPAAKTVAGIMLKNTLLKSCPPLDNLATPQFLPAQS